jgi:hypothetical protein
MRYLTLVLFVAFALLLVNCKKRKNAMYTDKDSAPKEMVQEERKLEVLPLRIDGSITAPEKNDPFEIISQKIEGDKLIMEVQYGGGCELHTFELLSNGAYMKSLPMKINLWLTHNSRNDRCRAMLTNTITFDISSIKPKSGNELHLIINGNNDNMVIYKY